MVVIRIARGTAGASPNAILDNQNNDFNAFFQDIDGIAVPANPAAGHRRLFVDSADDIIKVRTAGGATVSLEAGAGGGEANTSSNSGAGDGWALAKVGVDLPFKSLITTAPLSTTVNANDLTLVIALLVNADIAAGAAIATSKLADSANFILGNGNNDFNAFFQDLDGIAVPANPAAGHRRIFVDSADDILKVRTAGGTTVSLEGAGGGGGTWTDVIPCVLEVPEGVVAFPDVHVLATQVSKITGMVLPTATDSTINYKFTCPEDLAGTPNLRIRVRTVTLSANTTDAINLTLSQRYTGDTENIDQAFVAGDGVAATNYSVSDTIESFDIHDMNPANDPVAGDQVTGQIFRDVSADVAGDVIIVGIDAHIDRTTS